MEPSTNSTTVLCGHDSAESAHLTFAYPFGSRQRCVRREWVEIGTKGASRGEYRFVTQTTHPSFNREYSSIIAAQGQDAANRWAQERIAAGNVTWNAEKPSTYSALVVLIQSPLADDSGRLGTSCLRLSHYSEIPEISAFKTLTHGKLDGAQQRRLDALEEARILANRRRAEREMAAV